MEPRTRKNKGRQNMSTRTMGPRRTRRRNWGRVWWRATAFILTAAAALTGCDTLLDVELPGQVPGESLDNPQLANTLLLSAIGDFECALTNYAGATAALTDEFIGSTGWADYTDWDVRRITADDGDLGSGGCTNFGFGVYTPLQTARFQAEDIFRRFQEFPDAEVPDKATALATLKAYAGYSTLLLGEGFCEMAFDEGPIMTRAEVFSRAEADFTEAIERARQAGASDILNLALVGRARARLNLGRLEDAAADAAQVPEGYVKLATRSGASERRWNRIARVTRADFFYSVSPEYRDLEFGGVPDPRVRVVDAERLGHDGVTPLFLPLKYTAVEDPIVMASWEEAQLIKAEAMVARGDVGSAAAIINELHAQYGLPPYAGGTPAGVMDHIIEERRRTFFLDGHRLGDMLRYDLPFPSGVNHKGQPYGNTTCFPLPTVETNNNPNA